MTSRRSTSLANHTLEAAIAVSLILIFFLGLQGLLGTVFPSDSGFGALLSGMEPWQESGVGENERRYQSDGLGEEAPVATLTGFNNSVKARRGTSLAWGSARRGMQLHNRDAIQTLNHASASISFRENGYLDLGQNTHIVIRSNDSDIFSTDKRASVLMMDGELRGRLVSRTGEPVALTIALPGGSTELTSSPGDAAVAFRISVAEDSSASVVIDEGSATVVAGKDTISVGSSEYTKLTKGTAPSKPQRLEEPVTPVGPENGKVYDFRNLSPQVDFGWTPDPSVSGYRLLISRDPDFRNVVHDQVTTESKFTHGNLGTGTYYWKVFGIRDGIEVTLATPRVIHLESTTDPPSLKVWFPSGTVETRTFVLKGKTDSGTRILIDGESAKVDRRGHFAHRMVLDPGLNVVVVEAVDKLGNVAYESKVINSKP